MNKSTHTSRPYLVALAGGSGSGKTTMLRKLREDFTVEQLCALNMDDYYHPREQQLIDDKGVQNFDLPTALDDQAFCRDLEQLLQWRDVQKTEYTFNNDDAIPSTKTLTPAPIIVVEGLYLFHYASLRALWDYKVYIHAREAIRLTRRIHRDRIERNYPLDDVLYRYQHHVLPSHDQHIHPYKEEADLIIDTTSGRNDGYADLTAHLRGILKRTHVS